MNNKEQKKVEMIVELKNTASTNRQDRIAKFKKYMQMFNGELTEDESYPWRSKIFMKEVYKVIDTIHPIFMDMIFMKGDPFSVKGQDSPISKKQAIILSRLIKVFIGKMDAYNTIDDIITELLINGTAFAKMYWEVKTISKEEDVENEIPRAFSMGPLNIPLSPEIKKSREVVTKYVKDNPTLDHISYKDIFFSSKAKSLEKSWVIHRTRKTLKQLKEKNERFKKANNGKEFYKNLKDLEKYTFGEPAAKDFESSITTDEKNELGLNTTGVDSKTDPKPANENFKINDEGEIEILEYWNKSATEVSVVAGGMVLIKDDKNPFEHGKKPFFCVNYRRRPGEIWGIGICELAEDGQDFLNTSVNQAIDSNSLVNNLMIAIASDANIDTDQLKARPGGFIEVDVEPNESVQSKIQQMQFSKVDTSSEISLAMTEIREVTGASKIMQGTYESGAVRNTSQTRMLMTASNKKFMGKVLTFEAMFLNPFVTMMYQLISQFMTRDQVVQIIGDKGIEYIKVSSEDVELDLQFTPVGSKQLVEMEQLVQQLNNFLAIVSRIPMAQAIVKFKVLVQKIAINLLGEDVAGEILLSDEESRALMQQMMQQEQQQKAGGNTKPNTGGINPSQPNPGGGAK